MRQEDRALHIIRLSHRDNTVTAAEPLAAGEKADGITVAELIPRGHKLASEAIPKGAPVRRAGHVIGIAATDIHAGCQVHHHNLEAAGQVDLLAPGTPARLGPPETSSFLGYRRGTGSVGTRNAVVILSLHPAAAFAGQRIAAKFDQGALALFDNVDSVAAFSLGPACGLADRGEGAEITQRVADGLIRHPNTGGVLILASGVAEDPFGPFLEERGLTPGPRLQVLHLSDGGLGALIAEGARVVEEMLPQVNTVCRSACPVSELVLGTLVGPGDWTGLTANPALGEASDRVLAEGGKVATTGTPGFLGLEDRLGSLADPSAAARLATRLRCWEDLMTRFGASAPAPPDRATGISSPLEASQAKLSCAGTGRITDVIGYGEQISTPGCTFMDGPDCETVAATGLIAAGCTLVVRSTGHGLALGTAPAPCLSLCASTETYDTATADMDLNAGAVLSDGLGLPDMGALVFDRILATASGQRTASEAQGLGPESFQPWQIGMVV